MCNHHGVVLESHWLLSKETRVYGRNSDTKANIQGKRLLFLAKGRKLGTESVLSTTTGLEARAKVVFHGYDFEGISYSRNRVAGTFESL